MPQIHRGKAQRLESLIPQFASNFSSPFGQHTWRGINWMFPNSLTNISIEEVVIHAWGPDVRTGPEPKPGAQEIQANTLL